ncbi:MAG: hypothetical protein FJ297_18200 [Planctomycetes bacterium]|nr:hypothetical protein [Planctomycetota bacterium]
MRGAVRWAVWWLLLVATGCATHADRLRRLRQAFHEGDLPTAERLVDESLGKRGGDADVLRLEQAMILLAAGRPLDAEKNLREVRDRFDHLEQASLSEHSLAMLADDRKFAYAGEDYEKVLVRAMLALANLLHDGGDAEAYCLQVAEKQQAIIEAAVQPDGTNPKGRYQQVAFGPYLRAALREETHRDYDDVARQFAMVVAWEPEFTPGRAHLERSLHGRHSEPGNGVVHLFAFVGRGPYKEESVEEPTSAALLIADQIVSATSGQTVPPTLVGIKVPRLVASPNTVSHVAAAVDGRSAGRTETITDVTRMAVLQHEANHDHVVARAVARRVTKKGLVYGTKEAIGVRRGSIENLPLDAVGVAWEAMERADTRCWGLLPDKIQTLRIELPAGPHRLDVAALDRHGRRSGPSYPLSVQVHDGRNAFVLVNFPGPKLAGRPLASSGSATGSSAQTTGD